MFGGAGEPLNGGQDVSRQPANVPRVDVVSEHLLVMHNQQTQLTAELQSQAHVSHYVHLGVGSQYVVHCLRGLLSQEDSLLAVLAPNPPQVAGQGKHVEVHHLVH